MNKVTIENVRAAAEKVKMCVMGKIAEDIKARLPEEPVRYSHLDKYEMIKSGVAQLKVDLAATSFFPRYESDLPRLTDCFTFPVKAEVAKYEAAKAAIQSEKNDRELAAELAFNRIANERVFEMITGQEFLDELEKMAQQKW